MAMTCSVDGCDRAARTAGLCHACYSREARKDRGVNPLPVDYYDRQFGEMPTRGGMFATQVDRIGRRHVCGRCRNPWTGGREDCVNNRSAHG